ncbi:type 1 fimbrial protein [Pantoea tagorei]
MKNAELSNWHRMLRSALLSSLAGGGALSGLVLLAAGEAKAASLKEVDGEHGILTVVGELVDSPCRLSMDSHDQTLDLGTLASADLARAGARSNPVRLSVRLEGCLVAYGFIKDERTDAATWSANQPVVSVAFNAPADFSNPSLIRLTGVQGIALRLTDNNNREVRLGGQGVPTILTPGDNTLNWTVTAERVPGPLVPGPFRAIADFRLSYE